MAGDKDKEKKAQRAEEEKSKDKSDKKDERPSTNKDKEPWTDVVLPDPNATGKDQSGGDENEAPQEDLIFKSPLREEMTRPMAPMMPMGMNMNMSPWGYMNMMPWVSPQGFCGPMMAGYGDCEQYEEEEEATQGLESSTGASDEEPEEAAADEEEGNLLAKYQEKYETKEGEPVSFDVSDFMGKMWAKGRDSELMKGCYTKYAKPSNITLPRVELNNEVKSGKNGPTKDTKLRSIQVGLTQAAVPFIRLLDECMPRGEISVVRKKKMIDMATDGLSMLGTLNANINCVRRELLKPQLENRYKSLCDKNPKGDCPWLLGDDIPSDMRQAEQAGKLTKKRRGGQRGRGNNRFAPYPQQAQFGGMMPAYGQGQGFGRGGQGAGRGGGYGYGYKAARGQGMYSYLYLCGGVPAWGPYRVMNKKNESNEAQVGHPKPAHEMSDSESSDKDDCAEAASKQSLLACRPEAARPGPGDSRPRKGREVDDVGGLGPVTKDKVNTAFSFKWNTFKAGRASIHRAKWAEITSDRHILRDIQGFKIKFEETPVQTKPTGQLRYKFEERCFLEREIEELVEKGVLERVNHVPGEYISNVFLREKKDKGKFRMILNLKKLNEYIKDEHFKMDTLVAALNMVYQDCWFLSLDFTDAYYTISVNPESRKFLRFEFEGQLYEFTCLPNGLKPAPRLFTKLLKVPLAHMRKTKGIQITAYLDDTLLVFDNEQDALELGAYAAKLMEDLGFMISQKKSILEPTKRIEFLGVVIDSEKMLVNLTEKKTRKILEKVEVLKGLETCTIRHLAQVLGVLQATSPANPVAPLYTKIMERVKNEELKKNRGKFDREMNIPQEIKGELNWWERNLATLQAPITRGEPELVLCTDASLLGWGCYDKQTKQSFGGRWNVMEGEQHINALELRAVELALRTKCREVYSKHVRIYSDNMTTVASLRKQGSVRSMTCHEIARRIWEFMLERDNWISVAHLAGVKNVEADRASREFKLKDDIEWSLQQEIFDKICDRLGIRPDIDLFACRLNHKVERYCAWQPDPEAEYIDALSGFWGGGRMVYAFPPFGILGQVLKKFIEDEAEGLVIVPFWITKPWFTQWGRLLIREPLLINVDSNKVLYLPYRTNKEHPLKGELKLLAGVLSSNAYKQRAFRQGLLPLCSGPGEELPTSYTARTGGCGRSFVVKGALVRPRRM
jgi:hypothetical protein